MEQFNSLKIAIIGAVTSIRSMDPKIIVEISALKKTDAHISRGTWELVGSRDLFLLLATLHRIFVPGQFAVMSSDPLSAGKLDSKDGSYGAWVAIFPVWTLIINLQAQQMIA